MAKAGIELQSNTRDGSMRSDRARARGYLSGGRRARGGHGRALGWLRIAGALALLGMAAIHLQQAIGAHYSDIPTIGPLFVLNSAAGTLVALALVSPLERVAGHRAATSATLLALAGIVLAAASIVFLLISESTPLFGFREAGYRPAIVIALASEGAAVVLLSGYLAVRRQAGASRTQSRGTN